MDFRVTEKTAQRLLAIRESKHHIASPCFPDCLAPVTWQTAVMYVNREGLTAYARHYFDAFKTLQVCTFLAERDSPVKLPITSIWWQGSDTSQCIKPDALDKCNSLSRQHQTSQISPAKLTNCRSTRIHRTKNPSAQCIIVIAIVFVLSIHLSRTRKQETEPDASND